MLESCFSTLPFIEVILINSFLEITAKLEPSLIESNYSLIADITDSISKTSSSSKVERVN